MDESWIERVKKLAQSAAEANGVSLFDLESRASGRRWWIRVTLDREDGAVTITDCEAVSRHLSVQLDVEDAVPHAYELEVSSPGVERPLRSMAEFDRFRGKRARVVLGGSAPDAGQALEGEILGVEGDEVLIQVGQEVRRLSPEGIKRANLVFQFP